MIADIVVGLQHGDEAKGKVTHHLCKDGDYTHVLRFNGGGNAGHTIYHEGKKFIINILKAAAKQTSNTLDDQAVDFVKARLYPSSTTKLQ